MGAQQQTAAEGLLLWARQTGDIDRLLLQRRAEGECGQCHVVSVGSWRQTCMLLYIHLWVAR